MQHAGSVGAQRLAATATPCRGCCQPDALRTIVEGMLQVRAAFIDDSCGPAMQACLAQKLNKSVESMPTCKIMLHHEAAVVAEDLRLRIRVCIGAGAGFRLGP